MPSHWIADRLADLATARHLASEAVSSGRLPAAGRVEPSVWGTAGAVLLAVGPLAAAIATSPRLRRFLYEAVDTVIACVLLVALLAIVLGLPVGALYLLVKGALYFAHSILTSPWVASRLVGG